MIQGPMSSFCTNAQMHKCSNAQMLKCTNAQMHKCSNAQMHKCSNAQMHKFYLCKEIIPLHKLAKISTNYFLHKLFYSVTVYNNFCVNVICRIIFSSKFEVLIIG